MQKEMKSIYVVEVASGEVETATEGWQVASWRQHPALLPLGLIMRKVSTEAGDVEVYMPFMVSINQSLLYWAFEQVRQLHPKATDLDALDTLSLTEQLLLTLDLALEYAQLVEDGRGHSDRSRYIARCLHQIAQRVSEGGV